MQRSTTSDQESTRPTTQVALYARVSILNNQDPEMQLAELCRRTPITLPRKIAHERENFSTGRLWGCPWSAIVSSTKSMWADCAEG